MNILSAYIVKDSLEKRAEDVALYAEDLPRDLSGYVSIPSEHLKEITDLVARQAAFIKKYIK